MTSYVCRTVLALVAFAGAAAGCAPEEACVAGGYYVCDCPNCTLGYRECSGAQMLPRECTCPRGDAGNQCDNAHR